MVKKTKVVVNLDDMNLTKGTLSKEEAVKVRDINFGKVSKLPSLLVRGMADELFKGAPNYENVTYLNTKGMEGEGKEAALRQVKKDFNRILKASNKEKKQDIRLRVVDQPERTCYMFEDRKKVKEAKDAKKTAAGKK